MLDIVQTVCHGEEEVAALHEDYDYITRQDVDVCVLFADNDRVDYLPLLAPAVKVTTILHS